MTIFGLLYRFGVRDGRGGKRGQLRVCMLGAVEYDWHPRLRRHAEALAARGDIVTAVVLRAEGRPACEIVDGVRVERLPVRKYRGASRWAYVGLYLKFAVHAALWLARRWRCFDVIHVNTLPEMMVFAAVLPRLAGVPVVLDVHDRSAELFASKFGAGGLVRAGILAAERASYRFASHVLTVHEPYALKLRALTVKPVTVVMNCPDELLFRPRSWVGWDPHRDVVFGYHGLLARRHGLVEALEALALLRKIYPRARLQLWGNGDGLDELRSAAAALALTDAVHLPGQPLPLTVMAQELTTVHIGLVPSLRDPWTDGVLPTKLLEFASLGIPIITFRNPVIEAFFPDTSVTYVDPVTPERLAAAMHSLAGDRERARWQAANALEAMRALAWPPQKQAYLDLIDSLGARGRAGKPIG